MADVSGKYKLVGSENFDEFMKALGVGLVMRKLGNSATPIVDIEQKGDDYYIKTSTMFKTTELKFTLNQEFDENTPDGRDVRTTFTREGNKLIQSQKGDPDAVLTREFVGQEMLMVCTCKDVVCTRKYQKLE